MVRAVLDACKLLWLSIWHHTCVVNLPLFGAAAETATEMMLEPFGCIRIVDVTARRAIKDNFARASVFFVQSWVFEPYLYVSQALRHEFLTSLSLRICTCVSFGLGEKV